ncbi:MAG TPA: hypothetical protein VEB87_04645 [Nitrososphaerales archaeon]|nr:hypothetical protein [Nitrososphaerales archaeon]
MSMGRMAKAVLSLGGLATFFGIGALACGAFSGPQLSIVGAGIVTTAVGFGLIGTVCSGRVK